MVRVVYIKNPGLIYRLMLWALRWLYRRLAQPGLPKPVGIPLNRDPENECEAYDPRKNRGDWDDCSGDGHYLCFECCHLSPKAIMRAEDLA